MNESAKWVESNYQKVFERNRMPLFNIMISFLYDKNQDSYDFFTKIKSANIIFGSLLLLMLWFYFRQKVHPLIGLNLFLSFSFSFCVFKSAFAQVENIHHIVFFIVFAYMVLSIKKTSYQLAVTLGCVTAICYLLKASVLLMFAIYIFISLTKICFINQKKHIFLQLLISVSIFLLILSPYLLYNYQNYGITFYNFNSHYVMWRESWEESVFRMSEYTSGLENSDWPSNLPIGPIQYLNHHGFAHALERITDGLKLFIQTFQYNSHGFNQFIIIWTILTSFFVSMKFTLILSYLKKFPFLFLFVILNHVAYFLFICWYMRIDSGIRFISVLFLPYLFSLTLVNHIVMRDIITNKQSKRYYLFFSVLVLILIFNLNHAQDVICNLSINENGGR